VESREAWVTYCVDTSSLITLQRVYPRAVFGGVWDRLAELAQARRLVAPREVLNELERGGDDDIAQWAKAHRFIFRDPDDEHIALAKEIVNDPQFGKLFDVDSEQPDADPYVIALAVGEQRRPSMFEQTWVVVSDEGQAQPGKKPRIPDVCRDPRYQVECIRVLELFRREGWQF